MELNDGFHSSISIKEEPPGLEMYEKPPVDEIKIEDEFAFPAVSPAKPNLRSPEHKKNNSDLCCSFCEPSHTSPVKPISKKVKVNPFRCMYCPYRAFSMRNKLIHLKRVHSNKPFSCVECDKTFSERYRLKKHILKLHSSNVVCSECGFCCEDVAKLKVHRRIHFSKQYSCFKCDFTCTNRKQLKKHSVLHEAKNFKCPKCDFITKHKHNIQRHIFNMHREGKFNTSKSVHPILKNALTGLYCSVCGIVCSTRLALDVHMTTHQEGGFITRDKALRDYSRVKAPVANIPAFTAPPPAPGRNESLNALNSKPQEMSFYFCWICDYSTYSSESLKAHLKAHSDKSVLACEHCHFTCESQIELESHMKIHGLLALGLQPKKPVENLVAKKTYSCVECGSVFRYSTSLKKHLCACKPAKKDIFSCMQCDFTSDNSIKLRFHIKKHLRNVYSCLQCEQKFFGRDIFRVHMRSHRGEKVYQCTKCTFTSVLRTGLDKHMKKHSSGEAAKKEKKKASVDSNLNLQHCTQCTYSSPRVYDFKRHVVSVHGVESIPIKCRICSFTSFGVPNLKNHMQIVHNVTRIQCLECSYSTLRTHDLKKHMQRRHKAVIAESKAKACGQKKNFLCKNCSYTTDVFSYMKRHVMRVHSKKTLHKCPQCFYVTSNTLDLKAHVKKAHVNKPRSTQVLKCSSCSYSTNKMPNLQLHLKRVHKRDVVLHRCWKCSYSTIREHHLKRHVLKLHNEDTSIHRCTECKFLTLRSQEFEKHMQISHGMKKVKESSKSVSAKKVVHKCLQCSYSTDRIDKLRIHARKHSEDKKAHCCSKCSYSASQRRHLVSHMRKAHNKNIPLVPSKFKDLKDSHSQRSEEHEMPKVDSGAGHLQCPECSYFTFRMSHLKMHLQRHAEGDGSSHDENAEVLTESGVDSKPDLHQCSECPYSTVNKHHLKRHSQCHTKEEHVSDKGEVLAPIAESSVDSKEPEHFQCLECPYTTFRKHHLIRHLKRHSQNNESANLHQCPECSYTTRLIQHLKRHLICHGRRAEDEEEGGSSHHEEAEILTPKVESKINCKKPELYQCSECSYSALKKHHLEKHLEHHIMVKGHRCSECSYSVSRVYDLQKHIENIHKISVEILRCPKCVYCTLKAEELESHCCQKSEKTSAKLLQCPECSYTTRLNHYLKRHLQCHGQRAEDEEEGGSSHHEEAEISTPKVESKINSKKPELYQCSECSYSNFRKHHLEKHLQHHIQVKAHRCSECSYSVSRVYDLQKHLENIHKISVEILRCPKCVYCTLKAEELESHCCKKSEKTSTKHRCLDCSYSTTRIVDLKCHRQKVHNEQPELHSCWECSHSTARIQHLKRHVLDIHGQSTEIQRCSNCSIPLLRDKDMETHVQSCLKKLETSEDKGQLPNEILELDAMLCETELSVSQANSESHEQNQEEPTDIEKLTAHVQSSPGPKTELSDTQELETALPYPDFISELQCSECCSLAGANGDIEPFPCFGCSECTVLR